MIVGCVLERICLLFLLFDIEMDFQAYRSEYAKEGAKKVLREIEGLTLTDENNYIEFYSDTSGMYVVMGTYLPRAGEDVPYSLLDELTEKNDKWHRIQTDYCGLAEISKEIYGEYPRFLIGKPGQKTKYQFGYAYLDVSGEWEKNVMAFFESGNPRGMDFVIYYQTGKQKGSFCW